MSARAPKTATLSITKTLTACAGLGVTITAGGVRVSSLDVAREFGKQHGHVLRDIDKLAAEDADFAAANFGCTELVDASGKPFRAFLLTRDGFTLLAMGFTGAKAREFKKAYIAAFNAMEGELRKREVCQAIARADGKRYRLEETDTIKLFVAYAEGQGSQHAERYYGNLTLMTYAAMGIEKPGGQPIRDNLDSRTLINLATAEQIVAQALRDGMKAGIFYKTVFQLAKERVASLAGLLRPKLEAA